MKLVLFRTHKSKFQNDIAKNVAKHYAKDNDPCSDPNTVQYTKDSVLKKCPKKKETNNSSSSNSTGMSSVAKGGGMF